MANKPTYVLVGCEESQAVTIELRRVGINAYSCDLKPCSGGYPEWHLQMDVFEAIQLREWDGGIFFPDCTYLTNSAAWAYTDGPYHQKLKPGTLVGSDRRVARRAAIRFVKDLYYSGIERIAIENPIGVLSTQFKKPTQIIQPYLFGDNASKRTCLWLRDLPPLTPTLYFPPRMVDGRPRWGNQTDSGQNILPPSPDRALLRSKTYPGIARAMTQWALYFKNNI